MSRGGESPRVKLPPHSACAPGAPPDRRGSSPHSSPKWPTRGSPRRTTQLAVRPAPGAAPGAAPSQLRALGPHDPLSRLRPTWKGPAPPHFSEVLPSSHQRPAQRPVLRRVAPIIGGPRAPGRGPSPSPPSWSSSGPLSWEGRSERPEAAGRKATPPPPEAVLTGP